jgi:hypothetical protein
MGAAKDEASRPAAAIGVADTQPAFEAVGVAEAVSPVTTLQGSPPPPPPPPATSPLERPYGWSSTEPGHPRSASGEILVQKSAPGRTSQLDVPRVAVREDSSKAYVRKSTATPPGSARATAMDMTSARRARADEDVAGRPAILVSAGRERADRLVMRRV